MTSYDDDEHDVLLPAVSKCFQHHFHHQNPSSLSQLDRSALLTKRKPLGKECAFETR